MLGIVFTEEAGTFQQESQVHDGQLFAVLTFHLPAAPTTAPPGPVVVFWQLQVEVTDELYGDSSQRLVGPPVVEAVLPVCDAAGKCDLHVEVGGSITPALEASDLDGVATAGLLVAVTLARTYADGTLLQAVRPRLGSMRGGGNLAQPQTVTGGLTLSALIPADADEARHAEIPTWEAGGPSYDWGNAVAEALVVSTPSDSAGPTATSAPSASPSPRQDPPSASAALIAGLVAVVAAAALLLRARSSKRPT